MTSKPATKRTRRGSGAVTLTEVAALAGVAPITASRAINTPDKVSEEVLEKVRDAVERTGYVPNRLAGGLASSRSRLISAIVPSTHMSVFMATIESINNTLFAAGYQLILGQTGYSRERQEQLLESVIGRRPDGIFLTGILQPGRGRTRLMAAGIPVVETWDLTPSPIDMVIGFSHHATGQAVAEYLLSRKRRRFAIVTANDERAERRKAAFAAAVVAAGHDEPFVIDVGASRTLNSGRAALGRILAEAPGTDAVFCSSDLLALGLTTEARVRGIEVPGQLSVVGFGDMSFSADLAPALTTVRINGDEIGRLAAELLMARAEGKSVDERVFDVGFSIVERESA